MATVSIVRDHRTLIAIQTKLYTPPINAHPKIDGIFYRGQDFTQSYAQLSETFFNELKVASIELPASQTAEELHGNLAKHQIGTQGSGSNHFTTYNLSPALRHFLNDSCRVLEPLIVLLAEKYPGYILKQKESLNTYVATLQAANVQLNFDAGFIKDLYEAWNDYKHRGTKGAHTTDWKYVDEVVVKPRVVLQDPSSQLNNIEVDEFQEMVCEKILEFLEFLTKDQIILTSKS